MAGRCVSRLCTLACTWLLLQVCTQVTIPLHSFPNYLPKVATAPPGPPQTPTLFYGTFDLLVCPRVYSLVVAIVLLLLGSQ